MASKTGPASLWAERKKSLSSPTSQTPPTLPVLSLADLAQALPTSPTLPILSSADLGQALPTSPTSPTSPTLPALSSADLGQSSPTLPILTLPASLAGIDFTMTETLPRISWRPAPPPPPEAVPLDPTASLNLPTLSPGISKPCGHERVTNSRQDFQCSSAQRPKGKSFVYSLTK